ncbi:hypothetical membrane protein [Pseudomonas veronii 1YdBTEX2]|uniref:Hypothetical membrane protein n=1 Tax=Pseudomonas veronii 1YdBTEX2 TaxID=1295141 RepID=A0A1D3K8X2_PSEVE|nr:MULTISPECIES: hypothetical protein [Pseudomonas]OEC68246.1 hypothetical protein A7D21_27300 [Pseudomonas sp. AP19]SBW84814.1 hypothetical membrane protein [Pseudomonas veronii 1YdBTEX2]
MTISLSHVSIGMASLAVFSILTYKIASRHGVTAGVLAWVLLLAFFKFVIQDEEGPLWSIKIFGVLGGLLGWLWAGHIKFNPQEKEQG